ncbi:UBP1-associated protein 2C-like protein [Drosera capensis]
MDPIKKRKIEENGLDSTAAAPQPPQQQSPITAEEARKILEPLTQDNLLEVLVPAVVAHPDVLDAVRGIADRDVSLRKLFVRGIGWDTTSDSLRAVFAAYGELEEAVVILDKVSGKSKGYGFVTFKHIDGAVLALKEPSKKIDGRVAVAQLASLGHAGGGGGVTGGGAMGGSVDVSMRKIYVGNVPYEMSSEKLLSHFAAYGEIEEGPLGFDKVTGKSKGFALFVYKTAEGAQAAIVEPMKVIEGRQVVCKLASEGKKGRPGSGMMVPGQGDGMGMQPGGPMQVSYGGMGGYSGFTGGPGMGQPQNPMNPPYPSGVTAQGPGGYGGGAGYGGGMVGGYSGGVPPYGGPAPNAVGGYGAFGSVGGGLGAGAGTGLGGGGSGRGYGMPQGSMGMPGGGYGDGSYSMTAPPPYPGQGNQPTGTSPAPRVPSGGMYQNMPSYF